MKRIICLVLLCLVAFGAALAEEPSYELVTSPEDVAGSWIAWGSGDRLPFLVLHEDGTFEAYDWDAENFGARGELLLSGTFSLDTADGTFLLEGDDTVYVAKKGVATTEVESSDASVVLPAGTLILMLETPPVDDMEASLCFLSLPETYPNE